VDVDDIAFSCSLFSDKVDNTDGLNQLQTDAFGCMVQGSFLTYMYSVGRHSCRSSSSTNRTGKPYAAHLARFDYLLIYLHPLWYGKTRMVSLPDGEKISKISLFVLAQLRNVTVQLTLTKIIKIVATRWRILRLKCTKFDFCWGSAPDPAGGAYSAPPDGPDPLAGFGGPYF